ncbi:MAG: TetR family transcriptional regulator [Solirubrobacterales bacterium]
MPAAAPTVSESTDTRDRIIRATLRVIGERGIGAVSNRRLAGEAGVALGSLTYHFQSQTELLRESLLLYAREEVERLEAIAATLRATEPSAAEAAAEVERIVSGATAGPEQIAELELHLHAARDPALQDASKRCFAAYDEVAAAALETLGVPNPHQLAPTVVALLGGMALRRLGGGDRDASGMADALPALVRGATVAPNAGRTADPPSPGT